MVQPVTQAGKNHLPGGVLRSLQTGGRYDAEHPDQHQKVHVYGIGSQKIGQQADWPFTPTTPWRIPYPVLIFLSVRARNGKDIPSNRHPSLYALYFVFLGHSRCSFFLLTEWLFADSRAAGNIVGNRRARHGCISLPGTTVLITACSTFDSVWTEGR